MAKIFGLFGTMTGKVADAVMVVRNGEQIVRKYQPVVSNPSTPLQIASRARLKLMSQLAEVFDSGIAFRRVGAVSRRNKFVSANYGLSVYDSANSKAIISLANVDLTGGVIGLPEIVVTRSAGKVSAALADTANFDAVVYVVIQRGFDESLRFIAVRQITEGGQSSVFPSGDFDFYSTLSGYMYAYGIRFNNESARAKYMSLLAENENAVVEVIKTANVNDYSLSETGSAEISVVQQNNDRMSEQLSAKAKKTK